MFMKFLHTFFKGSYNKSDSNGFSDFFLHASEKRKEEVIREAAEKSNQEQIEIFNKSRLKTKTR